MTREIYAGVMSGTSLDGVDAVLADFASADGALCRMLGHAHLAYPSGLREELLSLQTAGADELARAGRASVELGALYADALVRASEAAGLATTQILAAGVHGQTLRHRPQDRYTLQLNHAALVAERADVTVVADFRSRDVAAGGQGAPLVPAFHAALFGRDAKPRAIVNVGGIANVTLLDGSGNVRGFDTGPGNVLMDLWCARKRGETFDRDGAWAATGKVDPALLAALLDDEFFARRPPKSTHRDAFDLDWLERRMRGRGEPSARGVQATLCALTARTIAAAISVHAPSSVEVLVCGGGANNAALMSALAGELQPRRVTTTAERGVAVDHVEALAFAWLAREALAGRAGNLPTVTGARGPRVLGAIYRK
jgi:anhydro-N-acetylmuramic acid kinase